LDHPRRGGIKGKFGQPRKGKIVGGIKLREMTKEVPPWAKKIQKVFT